MPVMTKGPQGDDIVILSRTEYDQLIAAANEDATDAETPRLMHSSQQRRRSHSSEKSAA